MHVYVYIYISTMHVYDVYVYIYECMYVCMPRILRAHWVVCSL